LAVKHGLSRWESTDEGRRDLRRRGHESQSDQGREVDRISRVVKVGDRATLAVTNLSGPVIVKAGGKGEIRIEAVKRVSGGDEATARARADLVRIEITERQNWVEVRTEHPDERSSSRDERRINVHVHYTVTAPPDVNLTVKTVSGDIESNGIRGDAQFNTVSGDLRVTGVGGASLKTVSGDIAATDVTTENDVRAASVSGDVVFTRVKARAVEINIISGSAQMQDVSSSRVDVDATSGDVRFAGALAPNGRYALQAMSGDITVSTGDAKGFEIEARSFSGDINSDVAMKVTQGTTTGSGRRRNETLRGVVGDGGPLLVLTTFSGDITIRR
jgi:DUF4097 and DUF4098 domain-containing protein YvlB